MNEQQKTVPWNESEYLRVGQAQLVYSFVGDDVVVHFPGRKSLFFRNLLAEANKYGEIVRPTAWRK